MITLLGYRCHRCNLCICQDYVFTLGYITTSIIELESRVQRKKSLTDIKLSVEATFKIIIIDFKTSLFYYDTLNKISDNYKRPSKCITIY